MAKPAICELKKNEAILCLSSVIESVSPMDIAKGSPLIPYMT